MKKIVLTSLFALAFASAANAGGYVAGYLATADGEGAKIGDTLDLAVTLGYAFDNGVRLEADIANIGLYEKDNDDYLGLNIAPTAIKALYDIKLGNSGAALYVGAGLASPFGLSVNKDELALQALGVVGVKYAVNKNVAVDLQYNRGEGYNLVFDGGESTDSGYNIVKLGVVYSF